MWVGLLLGLLVATVIGLLLAVAARRRGKETGFGYDTSSRSWCSLDPSHLKVSGSVLRLVFKDPGPENLVSFTAARSFSRNTAEQEATCESGSPPPPPPLTCPSILPPLTWSHLSLTLCPPPQWTAWGSAPS